MLCIKEVDGIACVLYMKVGQRDGCISSMKIHKASLADWGMDETKPTRMLCRIHIPLLPQEFISGNACFLILLMRATTYGHEL